jgi:hypothetical protein
MSLRATCQIIFALTASFQGLAVSAEAFELHCKGESTRKLPGQPPDKSPFVERLRFNERMLQDYKEGGWRPACAPPLKCRTAIDIHKVVVEGYIYDGSKRLTIGWVIDRDTGLLDFNAANGVYVAKAAALCLFTPISAEF